MADNVKPPATKFRLPESSKPEPEGFGPGSVAPEGVAAEGFGQDSFEPEGFEPVQPPPESVGSVLRRTRESFDQSVADVSASLNIRRVYLQALEDGHYDKLPGSTYAVGFLRSYAEYLNLDSKELARRFKEEISGHQDSTQLVFPVPDTESRVPGGALILVSLVLCALAYGAWNLISKPEPQVAELVPAVPDRLQGLLDQEQAQANGEVPSTLDQGSELSANIALANGGNEVKPVTDGGTAVQGEGSASFDVPAYETAPLASDAPPSGTNDGGSAEIAATETPADQEPAGSLQVSAQDSAQDSAQEPAEAAESAELPAEAETEVAEPAVAAASAEPETLPAAPEAPTPAPVAKPIERIAPLTRQSTAGAQVAEVTSDRAAPSTATATTAAEPEPLPIPKPPALDTASPGNSSAASSTSGGNELAALSPRVAQTPQVYGLENSGSRITLRAIQDSWIQVRSGPNDLLLTRVLQAGDTYRVPDRLGITMQTGNAGGLEVLVDGRNLGPMGPVGAVRRNVPLEVSRLLDSSGPQR